MALSSTSNFSSVYIQWDVTTRSGLYSVNYRLDDTDDTGSYSIVLENGYPLSGTQNHTDLGILQTIHASSSGFRDNDGVEVIPFVTGRGHTNEDLSVLEKFGSWNPLDAGSYERYEKFGLLRRDMMNDVERQGFDDGSVHHNSKIGSVPTLYTPFGDSQIVALNDWSAFNTGDSQRNMLQVFDSGYTSPGSLQGLLSMKGMVEWLRSHLDSDTGTIAAGVHLLAGAFDDALRYDVTIDGTDYRFRIDNIYYYTNVIDGVTYVTHCSVAMIFVSTDVPSRATLQSYFQSATATIGTVNDSAPPKFGSTDVPVHGSEYHLPGGRKLSILNDGLSLSGPNGMRAIASSRTEEILFSELIANGANKNAPTVPKYGIIKVESGTSGNLILPHPWDALGAGETSRINVHNHRGTSIVVQARNGHTLAHVQPSEGIEFLMTNNGDGSGEIRAILRDRKFIGDKDEGIRWLSGGTVFDSGNKAVLPVRTVSVDGGAFLTAGTATDPATNLYGANAWRVAHAGDGSIMCDLTVAVVNGATGNLPRDWKLQLWRQTASGTPGAILSHSQRELSGEGSTVSIPMFWAGTMNAGDTFALVVDKNSGSLANNQIDITGFVVECLEHVIVQYEYSA